MPGRGGRGSGLAAGAAGPRARPTPRAAAAPRDLQRRPVGEGSGLPAAARPPAWQACVEIIALRAAASRRDRPGLVFPYRNSKAKVVWLIVGEYEWISGGMAFLARSACRHTLWSIKIFYSRSSTTSNPDELSRAGHATVPRARHPRGRARQFRAASPRGHRTDSRAQAASSGLEGPAAHRVAAGLRAPPLADYLTHHRSTSRGSTPAPDVAPDPLCVVPAAAAPRPDRPRMPSLRSEPAGRGAAGAVAAHGSNYAGAQGLARRTDGFNMPPAVLPKVAAAFPSLRGLDVGLMPMGGVGLA